MSGDLLMQCCPNASKEKNSTSGLLFAAHGRLCLSSLLIKQIPGGQCLGGQEGGSSEPSPQSSSPSQRHTRGMQRLFAQTKSLLLQLSKHVLPSFAKWKLSGQAQRYPPAGLSKHRSEQEALVQGEGRGGWRNGWITWNWRDERMFTRHDTQGRPILTKAAEWKDYSVSLNLN